ncbi:4-hydroxy-3-methylbut-2-enyl diphosphate reductase [Actinospica robiniae]|uniref:4-hydroxy-3-methylbut-2-enyl diphosphate reductase n=1 Tax=Actinospica robiniae TaxID=304901 RepID=UPI0006853229|nr:4-hydroxy-3-methylbut-2-enyl diphosphate reductase [Actinospica robiniae]
MSSPVTVAAALGIEARALRRGAGLETGVVQVGMRAGRAARVLPRDGAPVVLAGVAGGLAKEVRAGDVVVSTEVHGPDGAVVRCPAAPLLYAALRRMLPEEVRIHLGPTVTSDRVVRGKARAGLAAEGYLAVDMEASVLGTLTDAPFATARVIVDDAQTGLWHPATVNRGRAALRTLTRMVPAFESWAGAAHPHRRVVLASPRSFCAGVERAIDIVAEALERYGPPVYVRRQIVHNTFVVADLERRGAVFVEELSEVPDGVPVVLSAHGVAPSVRLEADARGLAVVDATCPLVAKVHTEARRALRDGSTVVFIGHPNHDESEGLMGEDPDPSRPRIHLVETPEQAKALEVPDRERVAYLMQTTLAEDEAAQVVDALRTAFPGIGEPPSSDICYATTNRQRAIRDVAAEADVVLVIGSPNSSNSLRLVEVAERAGAAAYLADGPEQIDPDWLAGAGTIGLTAGASAPAQLVESVVEALAALGPIRREEPAGIEETYRFSLPPMPALPTTKRI